ncbi:UDP-2,4-diacetamido-2,4,6-trideoxy-beta-L-altropyranose hydrolase [Paraneptunicella aestuarii]|uniref:UDP-2,4-diacetamido-2,4, 6-trideoxy-beta-L-altropyranose hydrolase n=1 Tax=Paraneptunicella aestuarii TaxID=2831148 RepID=UPI001E3A7821|nr:UDP-2,4-diacetamido-2,4,6-trideoxy-beta-L-altropyranose hydrolase [Paraneptunicella aestuarii]UAA39498.1 UDP-2,4-diacetamido-2,4,6-trideoxy-beta-L-altropyranose hydrolase [Paraneptunicella aestuarii]
MTVLIRVDASRHIGVGHLMRCLALAQALDECHVEVTFIIRAETRPICLSRHDWVGQTLVIPEHITLEEESAWIKAQELEACLLILDGYQFDEHYRLAIKQTLGLPLVLFDDTNSSGMLHADIVINSAPEARNLGYEKTAPDAILCLGEEYRVLRREFTVLPDTSWSQRHTLTLVFGGSDVANLTIRLLQALESTDLECPIRVMTGAAYPFNDELQHVIADSRFAIQHMPNCQQVAEVFCHSRLVVSAAGSSQYELQACETPAILVVVADNQFPATDSAVKQGWCQMFDLRELGNTSQNLQSIANDVTKLWQDNEALQLMHKKARESRINDGTALLDILLKQV